MRTESFEFAIPLTSVSFAQLFRSLCNTSHFARSYLSPSALICLEHHQVWLPTSIYSSNSTIPIFVRYIHILLRLLVLVVPLAQRVGHSFECQTWMLAPLSYSFPYISMYVFPKRLRVLTVLHTA
ncbi:hypothetical protein BHE74_00046996 [Ensete ventricosum]|nr:hypothetical protein BHE74_00046996 [Ensete ventricosum]